MPNRKSVMRLAKIKIPKTKKIISDEKIPSEIFLWQNKKTKAIALVPTAIIDKISFFLAGTSPLLKTIGGSSFTTARSLVILLELCGVPYSPINSSDELLQKLQRLIINNKTKNFRLTSLAYCTTFFKNNKVFF